MRRALLSTALAAALLAGCGGEEPRPFIPVGPAEPRRAQLGWREVYPTSAKRLVFLVEELDVRRNGWSARVAVRNETGIRFETGNEAERAYGLMLFATGDLGELEAASESGTLPALRAATRIDPAVPASLAPGQTWTATLSAPGVLPAGAYARLTFGPFQAVGEPPADMERVVFWITDRSHRL